MSRITRQPIGFVPSAGISSARPNSFDDYDSVAIPQAGEETKTVVNETSLPLAIPSNDSLAIPQKSAKRSKSAPTASKLEIVGSGDSWSVSIGGKSSKGASVARFRVRASDAGFGVSLRFKDEAEKWRERYACYLSAKEWRNVRKMSPVDFVALIIRKLEDRKVEGGDAAKIDDLLRRLRAFK